MKFRSQTPRFRRRMAPLAIFSGLLVGVVLPGVNGKRLQAERVGEAVLWAQQLGSRLGEQAVLKPMLWGYDGDALRQVTDEMIRPPLYAGIRIDVPGRVAIFSAGPKERPSDVRGWAPVKAGDVIVGRVEVRLDASAIQADIQQSWIIASVLGIALCAGLFILPVRTVRRGDQHNQELWDALSEANANLEARVEARTIELRQLGSRLVRIQEEERARLSRDLHDELGQTLTGLRLRLTAMSVLIEGDERATAQLTEALKAIDAGVDQVRGLAHNLRPPALDALGLGDAISSLATEWASLSGLDVLIDAHPIQCDAQRAEVIFRVGQEALTNVTRHANASRVEIFLASDDKGIILTVDDDGQGLNSSGRHGLGLVGIRERLSEFGGRLTIETSKLGGVCLRAELPVGASAVASEV